jgi:hypothetical protein
MCRKLDHLHMPVDPQEIFDLAEPGSVGRLHVARVLVNKGYVATTGEAFASSSAIKVRLCGKVQDDAREAIEWISVWAGSPFWPSVSIAVRHRH